MGNQERAFAIILLCSIIGILLAIILQFLYDQAILIDDFVTNTMTLREVQFAVILVWELFGITVGAIESQ